MWLRSGQKEVSKKLLPNMWLLDMAKRGCELNAKNVITATVMLRQHVVLVTLVVSVVVLSMSYPRPPVVTAPSVPWVSCREPLG